MITTTNPKSLNEWTDFWYYGIGVNVIPANTKVKQTYENWSQWQDKSIPVEVHESYKKSRFYDNGIAIISGKIWRGPYKDKYLIAIDLDNPKAIEEFCKEGLEELKQKTLVEQTANPDKMHLYFIVDREIPNKASDKVDISTSQKIQANEIPALEVKSNSKGIMFCAYSPHKNGSNYQIKGTLKPEIFDAKDIENRISLICDKYGIPYGFNTNSNGYQTPIEDLWKTETKILKGHNRHLELLRIMESLLQNNRKMPLKDIKQMAQIWNQNHCIPPLDDIEFERQLKDALKFVCKKNINNNDITGTTGDNIEENSEIDNDYYQENKNNKTNSIADILVQLALKNSTLFKDEFGIPYSLLSIDGHNEVLSIDGSKFERYLSKLYYDNYNNRTANAESINNAIRILGAKAIFEGKTIPLYLRIAWSNSDNKDSIYYDLTDEKRRCIKITKGSGWKIVDNQIEVLFKRYGHEAPQIEPSHDYNNKIFDNFINSLNIKNENHKLLVKVWIVSLLIPEIPIPMFLPFGAEGSAKSTFQRKIKLVIDPSNLDLLSIYNDKTQFIQQLSHNFLCFYDNVRYEPGWLSDEACRAITGGAFSKRKLHTDDMDIPYKYKKRLSFSGINVIFKESDALDRSIRIEFERLDPKKKIPEERIEFELKQQLPEILGYIFDVVAKALEIKDSISLEELPRMADFALWGEAISRTLNYNPLEFLDAYFENIGEQKIDIIEANPFANAISKFINYEKRSWISSPKIFVNNLREFANSNDIDSSKFPKSSQAVSNQLRKIKANLLEGFGIEVIVERITSGRGNKKFMNTAIIKIRKRSPMAPVAPVNKNQEGESVSLTGDILDTVDNISSETTRSPVNDEQFYAQLSSETTNTGDAGPTGDIFRSSLIEGSNGESSSLSSTEEDSIQCHYCNFRSNKENEVERHSVISHPGKIARPDENLLELMKVKKETKDNYDEDKKKEKEI